MNPSTSPAPRLKAILATVAALTAIAVYGGEPKVAEVGKPAPSFTLSTIVSRAGEKPRPLSLADLKGKVVLVDFWATWCGPCRKSLPRLNEMKARAPGLEVLAISVDDRLADAEAYVRKLRPGFPALFDGKKTVSEAYGLEGMPTLYLIDRKGVLRHRHDGYEEGEMEAVEREVAALMKESAP